MELRCLHICILYNLLGERPFLCPYDGCNRSFTTSNIRKVHFRTHTGEKPYKCEIETCGRTFASATNYKNHSRIHTGKLISLTLPRIVGTLARPKFFQAKVKILFHFLICNDNCFWIILLFSVWNDMMS